MDKIPTKKVTFDDDVVEVLKNGIEWGDGNSSCKITRQLDRNLYIKVNKALELLGGKWEKKAQAHVFEKPVNFSEFEQLADTGEITIELQGFFETPAPVVERMLLLASPTKKLAGSVLEPSAGKGAILSRIIHQPCAFMAYEIDEDRAAFLQEKFGDKVAVVNQDFLTVPAGAFTVDYIFMNPPFEQGRDIEHIMHAATFLNVVGKLVAVCSASAIENQYERNKKFNQFLLDNDAYVEILPATGLLSIKKGISARLIVIDNEQKMIQDTEKRMDKDG